jgi:hypothetical protein
MGQGGGPGCISSINLNNSTIFGKKGQTQSGRQISGTKQYDAHSDIFLQK